MPMHYFAYGSNLEPEQMQHRCPGHTVVGLAELRDHRLAFPLTSHDWGGGVASVVTAHGQSVWGMVFDLTDADLEALDRYEGYRGRDDQHSLYDRETVTVELVRADDGSFPRRLRPLIYLARAANPSPPSRRYLDAIVKGAKHHRLPDDYIARLMATPVADPAE
jgi:gamma-glutamylcyclotransferase (GGCT)/AIG2-like uncharacterized protein YtfP